MPRIQNDPNLNVCPDYTSEDFVNTRAQLINENTTEEQVVQLLKNIWTANNRADKRLWQQQVNDDNEEQTHRNRLEEEEEERLNQERAKEEEDARKEERKKNKHKYTPIQNGSRIPDDPAITPCSYVLRKLDKGEYVELWYFTNDGLDEAVIKKTVDDDAMILSTLADGSTAWVSSASTRSARSVINDENLPFEEFCQACPRFLTALEEADWPRDRIRMMALFWRNLQVHRYRSLRDPIAQKTLLVYQSEQRRRWHVVAKSAAGPYDLSEVNEKVLEDTRAKVYWEERLKRDNARDYKVSINVRQSISSLLI
ncbi:hypothetical protein DFH29DRAFT_1049192 [Suillus ampliporus]|nr:hypothetical protein DFH29DRAFT_1049192 [Suillus ampliporus]